jgi:diaminohydroxyphosphoribosylaminopyrimidine deaminase/5-amino-6-(5-phosphoribosylamino)uracil reductase
LVAGQSIRKLKLAGTNVHQLNNTSTDISTKTTIIDPFFTNIKENRPYIILKWAETADCYMGCRSKPVPISNKYAQRLVHKWRSESDAIMIGSNTALIDDPQLNNRYYFGKSPVRIVIDKDNSLPPQLKIFDNKAETIIFNQIKNNQNKNVEFKQIPFDDNLLDSILNYLFSKKIGILFVEGGATLLQSFIGKNLWDEVRILKSKNNLRDIVNSDKIEGITAPKLTYGKLQTESQLYDNQLLIFKNS